MSPRYRPEPGSVTAKQACIWSGLEYGTYKKLVRDGCLSKTPAQGIDGDYFAALYLFTRLTEKLGFEVAKQVWAQIGPEMPPADDPDGTYLKLYVGIPMPNVAVLRSAGELDRKMRDEQGARAIDLHDHLKKARDFFTSTTRSAGGSDRIPRRTASVRLLSNAE